MSLAVKGKELMVLRDRVAEFHARVVAKGRRLTTYRCGHCHVLNETPQPGKRSCSPRGHWDSLKTCVSCGHVNMVIVRPDGTTKASAVG